jgi:hypothetical protein
MRNRSILNKRKGIISGTSRGCQSRVKSRISVGIKVEVYYSVRYMAAANAKPVAIAPAATVLPAIKDRRWSIIVRNLLSGYVLNV